MLLLAASKHDWVSLLTTEDVGACGRFCFVDWIFSFTH